MLVNAWAWLSGTRLSSPDTRSLTGSGSGVKSMMWISAVTEEGSDSDWGKLLNSGDSDSGTSDDVESSLNQSSKPMLLGILVARLIK